jgi:hypothetical protein
MVKSQSKSWCLNMQQKEKPELTGKGLISIYLTFDQLQQLSGCKSFKWAGN